MKLYKFDYRGTIGQNVMTVPTDSQFLIGIGNGDLSSTATLIEDRPSTIQTIAAKILSFEDLEGEFEYKVPAYDNLGEPTAWTIGDKLPVDVFKDGNTTRMIFTYAGIWDSGGGEWTQWDAPDNAVPSLIFSIIPGEPTYWDVASILDGDSPVPQSASPEASTITIGVGPEPITPEADKIGEYTCFRFETDGTPFRKNYKATIEGKEIDLLIICKKMSVAYRDFEGGGGGGSSPVPYLHYYEVEQDETIVVYVTPDNIADIAQTCYVINDASNGVEMKIDHEAFGETTPIIEFYVKCTLDSSDPNWYTVTVDENISLGDVVVPYLDTTEGKIWHSSIHEMVYAPGMFIAKVRYFSDEQDATAEILYNVTGGE